MKNAHFKLSTLSLSVALAIPVAFSTSLANAAEPYPALPPTLSNAVTPNIMLFIDTSGSMLQDSNNAWINTKYCDADKDWSGCVNKNTNDFRTKTDADARSKMMIAKTVAKKLISDNQTLRFGLFSFEDKSNSIGDAERGIAGVVRAEIKDMSVAANKTAIDTAIDNLRGRTSTPLAEGLLEITRYFEGKTSLYGKKIPPSFTTGGSYTSPIQYRCQKNFTIIITDGSSNDDDNLPGNDAAGSMAALSYTARNSAGEAVTKNFSICRAANTVTDDGYTVNCPDALEGSTTTGIGFGSSGDRERAVRDVAKYAQVADLRIGGTDLDEKSFDDVKFAKQNLNTFTVGFAVPTDALNVLPATAIVGKGQSYTVAAGDQATATAGLTKSLNDAISSINASVSNAGGVATRSEVARADNIALQPVFNPSGWYGELRCKKLDLAGNITGDCDIPKAIIPAADRKIYTSQVSTTATTPFDFTQDNLNLMSASQQAGLGSTATEQQNTINWVRGDDVAGLRSRPKGKLGDMVDAQPTIVAASAGSTPDADYEAFQKGTASRNMALVGANDGMMHAFNIGTMTELMGYVPHAVYRNLKSLPKTDYGGATPHAFFVNGSSRREDVKITTTTPSAIGPATSTSSWKTLLAGGLGQGGQGYFALDVTSASTLTSSATSAVKWEWNDQRDPQIGYSFGTPIIYNVRTTDGIKPAVIFSNGYENDFDDTASGGKKTSGKSSALFVVNADTGALIQKIEVKSGSTQLGSGLSGPAGLDYDSDGILDFVYAGDMNGKVWRFDLSSSSYSVSTTPLFDAGTAKPIVQRPGVFITDTSGEVMVIFGSGKMLTDADRTDTNTQTLYGVRDNFKNPVVTASAGSTGNLVAQTIAATFTIAAGGSKRAGTYRKMSANTVDNTRRGWYIDLPSGERLLTSPMVYSDKVLMGTGNVESGQVCEAGGKGWIMGLNPLTGSTPQSSRKIDYSFVDIDGDDQSTTADQLAFSGGSGYTAGFSRNGMPTELSFVAKNSSIAQFTAKADGTYPGSSIALREENAMAVFRKASSGTGVVLSGTIGTDTIDRDKMLGPASGVRVETGTWKELK